ncbi:MAG: UDP-2,3-diacylglucosamine diphosphatase [Fibrobacter sp.]|nr:UDP-2,3-diacylglucosamine diphosphatase [Fibrobacter sp.]
MSDTTTIFLSDAHFGIPVDGCEKREEYFAQFINKLPSSVTDIFFIGDIFDFWIEYRSFIRSDYVPILCTIRSAVERGIKVHYLAGNHDFALGPFLGTIGIDVLCDTHECIIQGKKVHLFHGDGIIKADVGYRLLKPLLRNQFNQRIYKLLHPDIGVAIASFCSGSSRKYLRNRITEKIIKQYRECAREELENGSDIVIYGHTHHAELCHFKHGSYLNTGAWLLHYNYAQLKNGELTLWRYRADLPPEQLSAIDLK